MPHQVIDPASIVDDPQGHGLAATLLSSGEDTLLSSGEEDPSGLAVDLDRMLSCVSPFALDDEESGNLDWEPPL